MTGLKELRLRRRPAGYGGDWADDLHQFILGGTWFRVKGYSFSLISILCGLSDIAIIDGVGAVTRRRGDVPDFGRGSANTRSGSSAFTSTK